MDTAHAKKMMDAFYEAKRIRDQMPPLPDGIHPSYINTLDALLQLSKREDPVRISNVADFQHLPRPAVTRTVKEMTSLGLIRKRADEKDRRVVHLEVTPEGEKLYQTYVRDYFGDLTGRLSSVSDQEVEDMVRTIHKVKEALL